MTKPLFDPPAKPAVQLSKTYSSQDHRLRRNEKAKWTRVSLKTYRPCVECASVQHETKGAFGPRRQVKKRRSIVGSPAMDLCTDHAALWVERDAVDSGIEAA